MFERLVRNHGQQNPNAIVEIEANSETVEFTQLKAQRRMIPEIRRGLKPIYADLVDHSSVLNRPSIPGLDVNTFFFNHQYSESSDSLMSKVNHEEADLIVAFVKYLRENGTETDLITVLTFYNGQRKLILRKLRERMPGSKYFKVSTVDGFQGEENAVIVLSTVRSHYRIGFEYRPGLLSEARGLTCVLGFSLWRIEFAWQCRVLNGDSISLVMVQCFANQACYGFLSDGSSAFYTWQAILSPI